MTQKGLKTESLTATVNKVFAGECVPEQMNACLFNAAPEIISLNCIAQGAFRKHFPEQIAKQIVARSAAANRHVVAEDICHLGTQWNHLNFSAFGVTEDNLF